MSLVTFVNLPTSSEEFKVVQIYFKNKPYLLCRKKESEPDRMYYHEKILRSFLSEQGLEANKDYTLVKPNPKQDFVKVPPISLEGVYQVVGAGFASINSESYYFSLPYGSSKDYKKLGILGVSKEFNDLIKKTLISQSSKWFKPKNKFPDDIADLFNNSSSNNIPF